MADSNVPSIDLSAALDPGVLSAWIDYQLAEDALKISALLVRYDAFLQVTANGIADDFICGHATDLAKELKKAEAEADKKRQAVKAPVLHAQRMIDGAAKAVCDPAKIAAATIELRITGYLRDKEQRLRAEAEAEARRLALEADAAIATANDAPTQEAIDKAVETLDAATAAEAKANASALDLTRTRGVGGAIAGLRDNWVYEVVDITKVPAYLLTINDPVTKTVIRGGAREIPGLRIWNEPKAYAR